MYVYINQPFSSFYCTSMAETRNRAPWQPSQMMGWLLARWTNLTTHAQPEALVFSGDAANDSHSADAQRLPKLDGLFLNLLSQLTSGGQDDGIRALVWLFDPVVNRAPHNFMSFGSHPITNRNKTKLLLRTVMGIGKEVVKVCNAHP